MRPACRTGSATAWAEADSIIQAEVLAAADPADAEVAEADSAAAVVVEVAVDSPEVVAVADAAVRMPATAVVDVVRAACCLVLETGAGIVQRTTGTSRWVPATPCWMRSRFR